MAHLMKSPEMMEKGSQAPEKQLRRQQVMEKLWRKRNTPPMLVGFQAGANTLEIGMTIPQRTGHNNTRGPCCTTPVHIRRAFSSM